MMTLKISIDPGSSATKVAYQIGQQPIQCFAMSPFCARVPTDYANNRWSHEKDKIQLESSWVNVDDTTFLLGRAAQKYYDSELKNSERKFTKALYKVLAILSYVQLREKVELPIELGILLPFDEYATKAQLQSELWRFDGDLIYFCEDFQPLEFKDILIRPEGAGLFLRGLSSKVNLQDSRIAILVIGHRNVSWLVMNNGAPSPSESITNDLGFRWMLQEVQSLSGFKDELALAEMIVHRQNIPPDMETIISTVLTQYWEQLRFFLQAQAPTDGVVCGGGAAWALKEQLTEFFPQRLGWANHLARAVQKRQIKDKDKALAQRMADCYGLLLSMGASDHE